MDAGTVLGVCLCQGIPLDRKMSFMNENIESLFNILFIAPGGSIYHGQTLF